MTDPGYVWYHASKDETNGDFASALEGYLRAAEMGDISAQLRVAEIYLDGDDRFPIVADQSIGLMWYRKAIGDEVSSIVTTGDVLRVCAQYSLGIRYLDGVGVPVDIKTGMEIIRCAANRGSATAAWLLGHSYFFGENGLNRDDDLAEQWFETALTSSQKYDVYANARGQICASLAECLIRPSRAIKDFARAQELAKIALESGILTASSVLTKIASACERGK